MSLLIMSVDNNIKFKNFKNYCNSVIKEELIVVENPTIDSDKDYLFKNFSQAGLNLELFLLNQSEYYSENKNFDHILLVWGDHLTDNLEHINSFLLNPVLTKDFLLFSHTYTNKNHSWVFGNIVSVIKWLSSLFKLDLSMFENLMDRDKYMIQYNNFNIAIWLAIRIGLKVYGVDNKL